MTGAFGFRCGEALCLKREDINVEATIPKITITGESIGARKSPGSVYVRRQHVQLMKNFLKKGVTCKRTRGHKHGKGMSKQITFQDTYSIPCTGYIFPSRKNAKRPYMCYHAVYNQVRRQAPRFLKQLQANGKQWGPEIAKLRPHSGRATLITELMGGRPDDSPKHEICSARTQFLQGPPEVWAAGSARLANRLRCH